MAGWLPALLFACAAQLGAPSALAAQTVAVFPFELLDQSQDGELILKVRPEETQRLAALTQDLQSRLTASKAYQIASLSNLAAEIKTASPLHKCDSCLAELAAKSGADIAMLGLVQKFSDTLLSVSIQTIDAKSGTVKNSYTVGVQGNTDEAWLRGVSYIVRNKMMIEGASQ
ncbi:MAG: DUF3280 domain-containing protein [Hyphomicrobiaceae bacterium]